eukprot:GHVU01108988.1.p1 GENE.GHVU01108988.1~~GHVU01108988.1.p1  ORF type:complete len:195 (+),score=18.74 GHVU01108988.1:1-585(+)
MYVLVQVRWQETIQQLGGQIGFLLGDACLATACVSYRGAFAGSFREVRLSRGSEKARKLEIPYSQPFSLQGCLCDAITAQQWALCGLPSDSSSLDNGVIVTHAARWPLLIDPQGRGSAWLKALYSDSDDDSGGGKKAKTPQNYSTKLASSGSKRRHHQQHGLVCVGAKNPKLMKIVERCLRNGDSMLVCLVVLA